MNIKLLRLAQSGFAVVGTAIGLNALNVISPVELLNPMQIGQVSLRPAFARDVEEDVNVHVYQQASPAVVSIEAGDGTGSGSIVSPDGLILTNAHVVSGTQQVKVTLADGRKFDGEVIAFGEAGLDLAAVRIRGQQGLPTVQIAPAGSVQVGQRAFAIGNPFGQFQGTFTTGIVSRIDGNRGLLQTDAAINPGNSGGPLLNSNGELIGVNSAIFSPRGSGGNIGIGFAIAVDRVQSFLTAVRQGRAPTVAQQSPVLGGGKPAERVSLDSSLIRGLLNKDSSVLPADNSYFNAYTFEGRAGQRVVVEMSSNEVDSYLILLSPDGRDLAQDDDSGGGSNARLITALPADGLYTVLANSYSPGETGQYDLRLATSDTSQQAHPTQVTTPQRPPSPTRPVNPQALPSTTPPQPTSPQTPPSSQPNSQQGGALLQEQGTLGPGASVLQSDGSFYREHSFQGAAGQSITISLESSDFDTYLILLDPNEQVIGENDDTGPNDTNSALTVTLPTTGTYRVIANAYDRTGRGRYTIVVR
jgi:serine protease Do